MSGSLASEANAEPNLTPILDLVFQLITFFMLVINFKASELDLNLRLPVLGSARPVDTKGQLDLLVLNVDDLGALKLYGQPVEVESYIGREAQATLLKSKLDPSEVEQGKIDLPTTVVLRADRRVRFAELNKVITTCQKHGFRQFAMRAMNQTD